MNPDSVRGVCGGCWRAPLTVNQHLKEVLVALLEGRLSEEEKEALRSILVLALS